MVSSWLSRSSAIRRSVSRDQCWLLVLSKMPATVFNGVVAMVGAPILGVAVMKALRSAHMGKLLA